MSNLKEQKEVYSEFTKLQYEILEQINIALTLLGGKSDIIGSVASWGDTQTDNETLENIKAWNTSTAKEQKERLYLFDRCENRRHS